MTSAQMRAIEEAAIASGRVTGLDLMERAARGAVTAVLQEWPDLASASGEGVASARPAPFGNEKTSAPQVVVLCGPGNNGGDGFSMARLLFQRGWRVHVLFLGDVARLPPDAGEMRRRWDAIGVTGDWNRDAARNVAGELDVFRPVLVVDALFGIGLSRPLGPEVTGVWRSFCDHAPGLSTTGNLYLCAVDVPSGVSDTAPEGERLDWFDDPAAQRLTVTFHRPKAAHRAMLAMGERLRVVDIGLNDSGVHTA